MGDTVALSGNDTITIKNRVFQNFADGDVATLTYPNDLVNLKIGKNGNSIFSFNESGKQADFTIRVLRGSADDKFLNNELVTMKKDFSAYVLLDGEFVKRIGDGQGNISRDIYNVSGGVITRASEAKSNVEGDTDQSVTVYNIKFSNAPRSLG